MTAEKTGKGEDHDDRGEHGERTGRAGHAAANQTAKKCFGLGAGGIGRNPRIGEMVRSKKTGMRGCVLGEKLEPKSRMQQYSVDWGTEERWEKERTNPQASVTVGAEPGEESWNLAEELLIDEGPTTPT